MYANLTHLLAQGTWRVDPSTTVASFSVSNFGFNRVTGTIAVCSGHLAVDADGWPRGLESVLDATSIHTGNAKRDADLRSPRFLDVERHPELRFRSDAITRHESGWRVDGHLTVGDTATPLKLEVREPLRGADRVDELSVTAQTVLDRAAAGIRAPAFLIGRVVAISITATLRLVEPDFHEAR